MQLEYYWSKLTKKLRGNSIKNSYICKGSKIESGTTFLNSSMDKYSFCGYDCVIINTKIGKFCSIASNVKIGLAQHPYDWVSTSPTFYLGRDSVKKKFSSFDRNNDKETIIGNDVWVGENVLIKQGITIGHGSVIGMGSVVTKDVEPYSIIGGNPAKLIKKRFEDNIIDQLLLLKWWDLSDSEIEKRAVDIRNVQEFIRSVK